MQSIGTAFAIILAIGTYVFLAQLLNDEACNAVARSYAPAAKLFSQIILVCI